MDSVSLGSEPDSDTDQPPARRPKSPPPGHKGPWAALADDGRNLRNEKVHRNRGVATKRVWDYGTSSWRRATSEERVQLRERRDATRGRGRGRGQPASSSGRGASSSAAPGAPWSREQPEGKLGKGKGRAVAPWSSWSWGGRGHAGNDERDWYKASGWHGGWAHRSPSRHSDHHRPRSCSRRRSERRPRSNSRRPRSSSNSRRGRSVSKAPSRSPCSSRSTSSEFVALAEHEAQKLLDTSNLSDSQLTKLEALIMLCETSRPRMQKQQQQQHKQQQQQQQQEQQQEQQQTEQQKKEQQQKQRHEQLRSLRSAAIESDIKQVKQEIQSMRGALASMSAPTASSSSAIANTAAPGAPGGSAGEGALAAPGAPKARIMQVHIEPGKVCYIPLQVAQDTSAPWRQPGHLEPWKG